MEVKEVSNYTKLKWYRFDIARRIRALDGEELIAELEEIIEEIKRKKLDRLGVFKVQIRELEQLIENEKAQPKRKGRQYDPFYIPYGGDGRVALFGLSNVGKSSLMNAITNAEVVTGNYLNTTRQALAGTCVYENVKIQIIDLPGFLDFKEDWNISKQILRVARTCDSILLVIDLSMNVERQYNFLIKQLEDARLIKDGETIYKFAIIATKGDLPCTEESFKKLKAMTDLPVCPISMKNKDSLDRLKKMLFETLNVVRVYTKKPKNQPAMEHPLVLPKGSTVKDVTLKLHKDFLKFFNYARIWGKSCDFPGQRVGVGHILEDEDIVEISTSQK